MVEREKRVLLSFEKGLDREHDFAFEPGFGNRLVNWEPTPSGGLLTRRRWEDSETTAQPTTRQVRGVGYNPVYAGFETPIRRQMNRRRRRGQAFDEIEAYWDHDTLDGSFLLAFLVISDVDNGVGGITITPPTGWTQLSGGGAPNNGQFPIRDSGTGGVTPWLKAFCFYIEDAASRDRMEAELFEFSDTVRRAQVYIMEWRGVKRNNAVQQAKTNADFSNNPDTGIITAETDPQKTLAVGFLAGMPGDGSFKLEQHTTGWYDFRWPKEEYNVGAEDNWLDMKVYRQVLTKKENLLNLEAVWAEDEDPVKSEAYWVAGMVILEAQDRGENDKDYLFVANKDSADAYKFYSIDEDDYFTGGAWTEVSPLTAAGATPKARDGTNLGDLDTYHLAMAAGLGVLAYTHRHLDRIWVWDGDILVPINRSKPGQSIAFYNSQFWTGGGLDDPNALYFSEVGDVTSWPDDNFVLVGDGEPIRDICPVRDGLLVAKQRGIYFVPWTQGPGVIKVGEMNIGGGATGRCIVPAPGGAFILGRRHIWYWGGGEPELVSRPIDDWWSEVWDLSGARIPMSGAYSNGKLWFGEAAEESLAVMDFNRQVWWAEKTPNRGLVWVLNDRNIFHAPWDSTTELPLLSHQQHPWGTRARDPHTAESFEAKTQELMLGSPARPVTPRHLFVAWKQTNTRKGEKTARITPIYDGKAYEPRYLSTRKRGDVVEDQDGSYRWRLDVGVHRATPVHKVQFLVEHDMSSTDETCIDIEAMELVFDVHEDWA